MNYPIVNNNASAVLNNDFAGREATSLIVSLAELVNEWVIMYMCTSIKTAITVPIATSAISTAATAFVQYLAFVVTLSRTLTVLVVFVVAATGVAVVTDGNRFGAIGFSLPQ